jgi:hypothetical protein
VRKDAAGLENGDNAPAEAEGETVGAEVWIQLAEGTRSVAGCGEKLLQVADVVNTEQLPHRATLSYRVVGLI